MWKKCICLVLSVLLITVGTAIPASAAIIETPDAFSMQLRQERIADIQTKLSRDEVQQAMVAMGVDPAQALLRVGSLTDDELARLAGSMDALPAGGNVLALIGVVFVVLLILELVGVTNVFSNL